MAATPSVTLSLALASLLAAPSRPTSPDPPAAASVSAAADAPAAVHTPAAANAPATVLAPVAANAPTTRLPRSFSSRYERVPRPPSSRLKAKRLGRQDLRGARTMVAVGGALLGVFYLGGTLAGATDLDALSRDGWIDPHERDAKRVSQLMFVPVVGPLVAAPWGESRGDKAALVGFGLLQGLGASLLVGGAVMLARDRRARRLEVSAAPMAGGGSVAIRGRF